MKIVTITVSSVTAGSTTSISSRLQSLRICSVVGLAIIVPPTFVGVVAGQRAQISRYFSWK